MVNSIKFSRTDKVLVGALSLVALGAGTVLATQQPADQAFAVEGNVTSGFTVVASDLDYVVSDTGELVVVDAADTTTTADEPTSSTTLDLAANDEAAVHPSTVNEGDIDEEISVTIDGEEIDAEDFDTNDVSVDVENKDTLEDSKNTTDVEVERSVRQRTNNDNDVDTDLDAEANIGDNRISGNENTGRIHNGNVKFNFSLPND